MTTDLKSVSTIFLSIALLLMGSASACPDIDGLTDRNCDRRLVVIGFGDSITFGVGDSLQIGGYLGRLKLLHPNIEIVNLGDPGESSFSGNSRASRTLPYIPEADYTIVLEGVNDYFVKSKSYNSTKDNLLNIVNIAKRTGHQSFLANLTAIKRSSQAPWVIGVNKTIAANVSIDFYSLGKNIIGGDNLHPNADGYLSMAYVASNNLKQASLRNKPIDQDNDGIYDFAELYIYHTSTTSADSDGDGLPDGVEVFTYGSNPNSKDSDGDGFSDDFEVNQLKSDPANANPSPPRIKSFQIIKES